MQNFQKQNELLEANYFQVEELEERLENGWKTGCPHTNSDGTTTYLPHDKADGPCPPDQGQMQ
jgi:hypothetical protein